MRPAWFSKVLRAFKLGSTPVFDSRSVVGLRFFQTREALVLMGMGALIGALSSLAVVLLQLAVHQAEHFRHLITQPLHLLLLPACGALLGIFLQRSLFGDKSAHGVPDVIRAVTTGHGILPRRMLVSRLVSSFFTVGSGGAAGLEGPIVVSGAAAGSFLARAFHMPEQRRSLLIACGSAGAVSGIFNAPLTGLVFSLEVILGEWKARNLVPTITSAAVATQVSRLLMGDKMPLPGGELEHFPMDLLGFSALGALCAVMGGILVAALRFSQQHFQKLPMPASLRAGLGGLGVGFIGMLVPQAMGEGYDLVHGFFLNQSSLSLPLVFVVLWLRMVTTPLTLGSGGAGGVFAPSIFLGSACGLLFGNTLRLFSSTAFTHPGAYALGGAAALVAGVMVAPLTGIFLVLEISGSYELILPLMLCTLSSFIVSRMLNSGSIYTRDLIFAGLYKPRGSQEQLLAEADWDELLEPVPTLPHHIPLGELSLDLGGARVLAIMDAQGRFQGLVTAEHLLPAMTCETMKKIVTLGQLAKWVEPLRQSQTPDQLLPAFHPAGNGFIPIVDDLGKVLGVVGKDRVFDFLRREIALGEDG